MRIPLVIRAPRVAPARFPHPVSLVDVAPTVLELLGVPAPPGEADGWSLAGFMNGTGAPPPERTLLIESYLPWISHGWAPFEGGVDAERKVIRSRAREAYDRRRDPREEHDLAGGDDPRLAAMFADVDARMAALAGRFRAEEAAGGGETASLLQALGYAGGDGVGGAAERPDFDALPDTYAKRPLIDRLDALREALGRGETEQAVAELRALVALDPENAVFLERLGETLLYANAGANLDEAERALERALALRPGRARVHLALASCAIARGDEPRIERELRTVLALEPDQPTALYNLSYLLSRRGHASGDRAAFAEAEELCARLVAGMAATDPRRAEMERTRADLARRAGKE
jgi:tetratricopeptide (TPR) repeat protein